MTGTLGAWKSINAELLFVMHVNLSQTISFESMLQKPLSNYIEIYISNPGPWKMALRLSGPQASDLGPGKTLINWFKTVEVCDY